MISLTEAMIVIIGVLVLGVGYTISMMCLFNDLKKLEQAEKEYCPTSLDDESEE